MEELKARIRDIPDFPKPGILFKDITPLLEDPQAFSKVIQIFRDRYAGRGIDKVVGIEARGFIFAAPLAYELGAGLVIVRKPGKLPYKTHKISYALEYGEDSVEMHVDSIRPGERIVLIDDVLATGGTMGAVAEIVEQCGGRLEELCTVIELTFLKGRHKLRHNYFSLIQY